MHLIYRGKITHLCKALFESCDPKGILVRRYEKIGSHLNNDYRLFYSLEKKGYVEQKRTGPRGGMRWHITQAGKDALDIAEDYMRGYGGSLYPGVIA